MGVLGWLTYRQVRQDNLNRALIAAIKHRDVPAGLAALRAGADPNSWEDTSKSLSFWQSLRRLFAGIGKHNEPSAPKPGQTALIQALTQALTSDSAEDEHIALSPLIRALVTRGANVNGRDKEGDTPLMLAVGPEPADTVQAMLDRGAEVNARDNDGRTALMWAAQWGGIDIAKILLARGAEVNARSNGGVTALIIASGSSSLATVKLLLAQGADVNVQDEDGTTALMGAARSENTDMVNLLLAQGAKIDARDDFGNTALLDTLFGPGMHAMGPPLHAVVACLLQHGASVHIKNVYGQSVQSYASSAQSYVSSRHEKQLL
jgi:hypothetical protein